MTDDAIREEIRRAAVDGKVPCTILLDLARKTGTSPLKIGEMCDEMRIRVASCQLGCFP